MRIQFREVEFPGKQADHGANRSNPAVASRLALDGLEQTIESFQEAVGLACLRPSDDSLDMVAEACGRPPSLKTLLRFFRWFGAERSQGLRFICSDMWKPYLRVVAKKAGQAIHVLDRFHIMAHCSRTIDEVCTQEAKTLKAQGLEPVLTQTRWLLLKRPENLSEKQETRLAELLRYNLRTARSYLLKENF